MVMAVNMQVNLGGLVMANPVTDASGTFAAGREYSDFVNVAGMGAVTTKGVSLNGWEGNESPRIAETPSGMLNSIGLQNPGVKHLCEVDLPWLKSQGVPAIVNVSGHSLEEYVSVVEALEEDGKADAYEINISCPNVDAGGLTFGTHVPSVERVVSACREAATKPMIVKLTPNVTDITEIAKAAEASGADAISLINTLLGMGGISTATDAVEFMLAGATAVAVGTANFTNPHAVDEVIAGIEAYCEEQGVADVNDLIGGLQC